MLETQIGEWRSYLLRRQAIHSVDVAELEDHLREQIGVLQDSGLDADEAFLVAVKRMGDLDTLSREFAREHSGRLWKQLVVAGDGEGARSAGWGPGALAAFGFAVAAALAIKLLEIVTVTPGGDDSLVYFRNLGVFVLPVLAVYFFWKRALDLRTAGWLGGAFAVAALFANAYPWASPANTEALTTLHLPIALWLVVGAAYAGRRWNEVAGRMDFIRFSGELFIYFVLIALGGGVFAGFMAMIFGVIGIDIEPFFESWLLPCGAAGALVVASWLVEAKQSVVENMAPVLTRLFTPLFAIMLVTFLGTLFFTGRGIDIERDMLIAFDLLLIVVLGLLLYAVSARDPQSPPDVFDVMQIVLVVSALLADAVALWAISARIFEFGVTPNRVAALGVNVLLLVNLAWSAVLYLRFMRARLPFSRLERWQTNYLPVYGAWAAVVVVVFPPAFGYL